MEWESGKNTQPYSVETPRWRLREEGLARNAPYYSWWHIKSLDGLGYRRALHGGLANDMVLMTRE